MKHSALHEPAWQEPPKVDKLPRITESGRAWITLLIVVLVLAALVLGFVYSTSPATVHLPPLR